MRPYFWVLLLVIIGFTGCDLIEGPQGPEGPEGPQGAQGPPGVANIEKQTFTLKEGAFTSQTLPDGTVMEGWKSSASVITQDVVNEGLVLAYTDLGAGGTDSNKSWVALPWTLVLNSGSVSITHGYSTNTFEVLLMNNQSKSMASSVDGWRVRCVVVPPSTAEQLQGKVDLKNYEAVVEAVQVVTVAN